MCIFVVSARTYMLDHDHRKEVTAIDTSISECVLKPALTHAHADMKFFTAYLARDLHKELHVLFLSPITATKTRTRQIEFKTKARRGSAQEHEIHTRMTNGINHTVSASVRAYGEFYIYINAV